MSRFSVIAVLLSFLFGEAAAQYGSLSYEEFDRRTLSATQLQVLNSFDKLDKLQQEAIVSTDLLQALNKEFGTPNSLVPINILPPSDAINISSLSVGRVDSAFLFPNNSRPHHGMCTAVYIGVSLVLTARHCLFEYDQLADKANIDFNYRYGSEVIRDLAIGVDFEAVDSTLDLALVRLFDDVPKGIRPVTMRIRDPVIGETLYLLGHPDGDRLRLSNFDCRSTKKEGAKFLHTCDTKKGSSGSPLFSASDHALVGIHIGRVDPSDGRANIAVLGSELLKFLMERPSITRSFYSVDVNESLLTRRANAWVPYGRESLLAAANDRNWNTVKQNIEYGVSPFERGSRGNSVVFLNLFASRRIDPQFLAYLHEEGVEYPVGDPLLPKILEKFREGKERIDDRHVATLETLLKMGATGEEKAKDGFKSVCFSSFHPRLYGVFVKNGIICN